MKKYIAYVDGFNLYNRRLKNTSYKWLNLSYLMGTYGFEDFHLEQVKYFTAKVINRSNNPAIKQRQDFYLRALKTEPTIKIFMGQFKAREVSGELLKKVSSNINGNVVNSYEGTNQIVKVKKFEEKGSDVNMATEMLADAFQNRFDVAIVITNDVDLKAPLKVINDDLKKPVVLISPESNFHVPELKRHSSLQRYIEDWQLAKSQFPNSLSDSQGRFNKPSRWQP